MPSTTWAATNSLDRDFGWVASGSPPATYYIGLSTTEVDASGSPSATEPVGGAYARVALANNKTNWSYATNGSVVTTASFAFPMSTTSWGTIVSAFLTSAGPTPTSGSIWFYYTLNPPIPVPANTIVTFAAGTLTATRS